MTNAPRATTSPPEKSSGIRCGKASTSAKPWEGMVHAPRPRFMATRSSPSEPLGFSLASVLKMAPCSGSAISSRMPRLLTSRGRRPQARFSLEALSLLPEAIKPVPNSSLIVRRMVRKCGARDRMVALIRLPRLVTLAGEQCILGIHSAGVAAYHPMTGEKTLGLTRGGTACQKSANLTFSKVIASSSLPATIRVPTSFRSPGKRMAR